MSQIGTKKKVRTPSPVLIQSSRAGPSERGGAQVSKWKGEDEGLETCG